MQASAGACLLLHLRCTSRGILQITGFTHHHLCGVKNLHVIVLSPTFSFPRQVRQPCLKDLLLTRKAMTSQCLLELIAPNSQTPTIYKRLPFRRQ